MSARALRGGTSSAVHQLTVRRPGGVGDRVVLRRYVRPELNAEDPDIADREQRALRIVAGLSVPTPELLACDPTGDGAGVPALLMSHLDGRVDWLPGNMDRWLSCLAGVLPAIHDAPLPPAGVIQPFRPYEPERETPPRWMRRPAVWDRALEIFHGRHPHVPPVLIHRDFHPGNVLWKRQRVTGVVDWQAASFGPATVDVGHCRANLLGYGLDVVESFTTAWERVAGTTYHPGADIVGLLGLVGTLDDSPSQETAAAEVLLTRAVAQLT